MKTAQILSLLGFVAVLCMPFQALAKDPKSAPGGEIWEHPQAVIANLKISLDLPSFRDVEPDSFVNMVTMRKLPRGSMFTIYQGPRQLILKHARKRLRRLQRKHEDPLLNYESEVKISSILRKRVDLWASVGWNGNWWEREWYESLPTTKGGAPITPFIHVVGRRIKWKWGPLTVSNTLSLRLDYIAVLRINTAPETQINPDKLPIPTKDSPITVDVQPFLPSPVVYDTTIDFDIKPIIRIGLPRSGDLLSFLRKIALRLEATLIYRGKPIIHAQCELKYDPRRGFSLTADIAFVRW